MPDGAMVEPWRTLSSERLVHDRWIDLRADRCTMQDGAEIAPYYVLTYPDWVHVVALTPDDGLVLVELYRHGAGVACLELPGGAVDSGDADIVAAARRELREETGYEAEGCELVSSLYANPANQTNRVHAVLATGCRLAGAQRLESGEAGLAVRCVPLGEVLAGLPAGMLPQSMQVAGLLLALAKAGRAGFR